MATTQKSFDDQTATGSDAAFLQRHEQDLSAKTFVKTKGTEIIIPWIALAGGMAAGYFTLGKPIRAIAPGLFKTIDHSSDIFRHALDLKSSELKAAAETVEKIVPEVITKARKVDPNFKLETARDFKNLLGHASEDDVIRVKRALNVKDGKAGEHTAKWIGAAALGTITSTLGSIFVGYGKWKKEESTRLAAQEIDSDIARLEVFSKRDPELVAENKRLRSILNETDAKPDDEQRHGPKHETAEGRHHRISAAQHQGMIQTDHERSRGE